MAILSQYFLIMESLNEWKKVKIEIPLKFFSVLDECCELEEKQRGIFFHMNAWRVRTVNYAFNAAISKGIWSLAYNYGLSIIDGMR